MLLKREKRTLSYRKESFEVVYHYFLCEDSGEQFVTDALGDLNLRQVYNQYRAKHNLPFPEEIRSIREQYGLAATKMSEILGLGINSYGNYERGEVPSHSNARIIQMAARPKQFRQLVELTDAIDEKTKDKINRKLDALIQERDSKRKERAVLQYLLPHQQPDAYSGYRKPSLKKIAQMVVFFGTHLHPWKTQLNKLLFYADFLRYKHSGFSISGLRYRAIDRGPVPTNYGSLFEYLENKQVIEVDEYSWGDNKEGKRFRPATDVTFQAAVFTAAELEILKQVKHHFSTVSTQEIIELSHQETAWEDNHQQRQLISYEYAFFINALENENPNS